MTLSQKVAGLAGPDREVDEIIRATVFGPVGCTVEKSPFNGEWVSYLPIGFDGKKRAWEARRPLPRQGTLFTASLDAAMTLVPEHSNTNINIGPSGAHAVKIVCPGGEGIGIAATPALALASAALAARGL